VLNLSRCDIRDRGAKAIQILIERSSLRDLNLHWNKITSKGACYLAEALKNTVTLKMLDLAWNSMGSGMEGKIGSILGEALQLDVLLHLDISYNKFSKKDCLDLGDKLKEN